MYCNSPAVMFFFSRLQWRFLSEKAWRAHKELINTGLKVWKYFAHVFPILDFCAVTGSQCRDDLSLNFCRFSLLVILQSRVEGSVNTILGLLNHFLLKSFKTFVSKKLPSIVDVIQLECSIFGYLTEMFGRGILRSWQKDS